MNWWHKLTLHVSEPNGKREKAVMVRQKTWPRRLLRLLFGDFTQMVLLEPGQMICSVEVKKNKESEEGYGKAERIANDA